jgi:hypothetical protein
MKTAPANRRGTPKKKKRGINMDSSSNRNSSYNTKNSQLK